MADVKNPKETVGVTENKTNTVDLTGVTAEQIVAAQKAIADKKTAQQAKIAEIKAKIVEAKRRKAMYEGDSEDVVEFREFTIANKPNAWKAIQEDPAMWERELADYMLSILPEGAKKYQTELAGIDKQLADLNGKRADLHAKAVAEFPDVFGTPAKAAKAKTAGTGTTDAEVIPFTGTLLTKEAATARVKELIAGGMSSETDIIKEIYPGEYTINGSKPRFQIHAIRVEIGAVVKQK